MMDLVSSVFTRNSLIVAFAVIGLTIWLSYWLADKLTAGRIHGSAIAIALGLVAAYWGGTVTGGAKGVADLSLLGGIGLMGGGMLRDFAIVSTAFGVQLSELKKAGLAGVVSIFAGVIVSFIVGAAVAVAFGYTDPIAITTIGAGAVTYIVGPVTGEAIGASGDVVTLSVAAGLVKSILVMIGTCGGGAGGHGPETRALRCNDGYVLHRRRLSFRPVTLVFLSEPYFLVSACLAR